MRYKTNTYKTRCFPKSGCVNYSREEVSSLILGSLRLWIFGYGWLRVQHFHYQPLPLDYIAICSVGNNSNLCIMCLNHECFTLKAQLCLQPSEDDVCVINSTVFKFFEVKPLLKARALLALEYSMKF